jgi:hypothetical protein
MARWFAVLMTLKIQDPFAKRMHIEVPLACLKFAVVIMGKKAVMQLKSPLSCTTIAT